VVQNHGLASVATKDQFPNPPLLLDVM